MIKRVLALTLVVLTLVIPFILTVSASSADPIGWILEALQAIDYINNLNEDVRNMSGDEYYDFITEQDSFDSAAWLALISTLGQPVAFEITENFDNMHAAKYNAVKVQEDSIRNIYNQATKINTANLRYFSFDDLGLSSHNSFDNSITYTGYNCLPNIGNTFNGITAKNFDGQFTKVGSTNTIEFYNGSSMAFPVFYVPDNVTMYQSGIALPDCSWYIPLGSKQLLRVSSDYSNISPYTYSGDTLTDLTLGFYTTFRNELCLIYQDGVNVGTTNTDEYPGWEVADLLSKMVGYCITTDGDSNAGVIAPPADIPYDDDGYVYVCIPEDKSDVVYLSPTTYNEYINNGSIVEGDYVSNVTDETVNNITNNITNIYEGSSYDDTNLLNKLGDWFGDIKSKLNTIIGLLVLDDLDIPDKIGDILGVDDDFSIDDIELDFKSLIQAKLPILAHAAELVRSLQDTNNPIVIEAENPMNWLLGTVSDADRLDNFVVNVSWYDTVEYKGRSGREYVRDGLSIIMYILAFVAIYRKTDSIFSDL